MMSKPMQDITLPMRSQAGQFAQVAQAGIDNIVNGNYDAITKQRIVPALQHQQNRLEAIGNGAYSLISPEYWAAMVRAYAPRVVGEPAVPPLFMVDQAKPASRPPAPH